MTSSASSELVEIPEAPQEKLASIATDASILGHFFKYRLGEHLTEAICGTWAEYVAANFKAPITANTFETLRQYQGKVIDLKLINVIAFQLAANRFNLLKRFILAYDAPVKAEWIGVEVTGVTETVWESRNRPASTGAELDMIALTGHPAGHHLRRKFPLTWVNGFAYKLGFHKRVPFDYDVRHLIRMRFMAYVVPRDSELTFEELAVNPRELKYNRGIIRLRTRFDFEQAECPKGHAHLCWNCPVSRGECPASVKAGPN